MSRHLHVLVVQHRLHRAIGHPLGLRGRDCQDTIAGSSYRGNSSKFTAEGILFSIMIIIFLTGTETLKPGMKDHKYIIARFGRYN